MRAALFAPPKQAGAHHGGEGERNDQAHHHCHRRGDAELEKKPSRHAGHERDRHENHDETQRGGENGQADFLRGGARGLEGIHLLLLDKPENIFEHHDGVIDDDANHQHERQHRHAVQREVQRPHHPERGDDGRWDGDAGDDHRAPVLHEEQHHEAGQDAAENQMHFDFVQRFVNETRLIADDLEFHVRRQFRGD